MSLKLAQGLFTCSVSLEAVRPIRMERRDADGVTSFSAGDYELAYKTILQFEDGRTLAISATLLGDLNRQVVIRDEQGRPQRVVGYAQGRAQIRDHGGALIFEGHYHDTRIAWELVGDEALTPTGVRAADHWENCVGVGPYLGRVFSIGVRFSREGATPMRGQATGRIE